MTKERLEELIKQGATIYYAYENGCVKTIDLSYGISKFKIGKNYVERKIIGTGFTERYITNKLFEIREKAEWCRMTAERTERFEPPMWEDLQEDLEVIDYKFAFTINGNCNYLFWVAKDEMGGSIEIRKFNVYKVETTLFYSDSATKENYIKACEIVRDLFNRGNK